ncbi:MAG: hypothetical protein WB810_08270 [Candidatus Cybelea sp.]
MRSSPEIGERAARDADEPGWVTAAMFTVGAILLAALSGVGASCDVLEQAARVTKALAREENAECATAEAGFHMISFR